MSLYLNELQVTDGWQDYGACLTQGNYCLLKNARRDILATGKSPWFSGWPILMFMPIALAKLTEFWNKNKHEARDRKIEDRLVERRESGLEWGNEAYECIQSQIQLCKT